jgi:UDP-hydrolysing UDP-N-acetyl-D-glucosamine 2-epimerase
MPPKPPQRRVCFVTGTRAEFGLMRSTLEAIQRHPDLKLQIIATGMHLSRAHGQTVEMIGAAGWALDAVVPWGRDGGQTAMTQAASTGRVMGKLAKAFERLKTDVVLVVGDRVEAFAAASAGHISGRIVAHVHGGDRALGQVDDSLRHAITKLAHIHFPATRLSAERLVKLGEDRRRIHRVGSPGIDGIVKNLPAFPLNLGRSLRAGRYALVVLHPTEADEAAEYRRAKMLLSALRKVGVEQAVIVYPNNDPGSGGIIRCWQHDTDPSREFVYRDIDRPIFLSLMARAAMLVGNSSSGIIEAASFGTPVIDLGPRQQGRERSQNVTSIPFVAKKIEREARRIWNTGRPVRYPRKNVYGGGGAGQKIANVLARISLDDRLRRKLIAY